MIVPYGDSVPEVTIVRLFACGDNTELWCVDPRGHRLDDGLIAWLGRDGLNVPYSLHKNHGFPVQPILAPHPVGRVRINKFESPWDWHNGCST